MSSTCVHPGLWRSETVAASTEDPSALRPGAASRPWTPRRVPGTGAIGGSFTVRWRGQDRTTASGKRLINRLAIPPDPLQEFVHRRGAGLKAKMVEALL